MHRTIRQNSQRWESCALPKAAKKPCCSHWRRCLHCKFQPEWWQNRVPNLLIPWCHVWRNEAIWHSWIGSGCRPTGVSPCAGAAQPFLTHTQLSSLASAPHGTAGGDTALVCSLGSSEMYSVVPWASSGWIDIWQLMKDFLSMNWSN